MMHGTQVPTGHEKKQEVFFKFQKGACFDCNERYLSKKKKKIQPHWIFKNTDFQIYPKIWHLWWQIAWVQAG